MFESMSYLTLQHYWWAIISLLAALLVFLMFVQGGQTLIYRLGKTSNERTMIVNALGRKWEFTFTTLVTFGGALFASFPLFYSTSFGGAYWAWMALLFAFIIQAVSYEFRSRPSNFLGKRTFDVFLFVNGLLGTVLLGVVVGTFFNGANFSVSNMNLSQWENPAHGLEAVLTFSNVALGLAIFFLARVLSLLYFMNSIDHETIFRNAKKQLLYNTIPFLVFFLYFVVRLLLIKGFAYDPKTFEVSMEPYKYLHNFLQMPVVLIIFLVGVVGVLWGIISSLLKDKTNGIWYAGIGTVLTIFALMLVAGYNNTCCYPSNFDLQSSLTIVNSSSSKYTLTVMSYVSLMLPFVLAYIWYAWKAINREKITESEITGEGEGHVY
ncbi:cytochrome D ubiquinol oxidase subunit II [Prolixibacter sp. SD074]|jgi:cytochrome d ubiquinol oxidase subunit II|uniref:Cytochrome D Ubiquinol oxidase subunit II n=2 Tax=Prolixibacteraceae TaxID=1471398 RepID=A0A2P8CK06_9BACT|nr:cytochrome d ubiquinol oxidase subunit II [Prolixibacter denitrificans]GET19929.1 cytochrome D ubiquinol oxidase subunit II [Prolixibacter denitrificans]GET30981.1 cytochrome D ubiquinol oxidase subunit II [Prolixibacter sp. SD074]